MKQEIDNLNPDDYVKLFNIKETIFTSLFEVTSRQELEEKGFPNIELIYIDGPFYFLKKNLEKYNFSIDKFKSIIDMVKEEADKFLKASLKFNNDFSNVSWEELIVLFNQAIQSWIDFLSIIDMPIYCSYYFEKQLADKFSPEILDILSTPLYESYNKRRNIDYHKLQLGRISREEFKEKWRWSYCTLFHYKELDDSIIDKTLDEIKDAEKELADLNNHEEQVKRVYEKAYAELNPEQQQIADIMQGIIFIRDYRFEMAQRGIFNLTSLFRETAKRLNISYEELTHMTPDEIRSKNVSDDVKKRMKQFAVFRSKILVDDEFRLLKEKFDQPVSADEIKGTTAYKGKVKGVARIIRNRDDLHKLNQGEILVADITTPDFMVAIKKAAAIVTNIGGISSHSAVVAREFKIPCIVGTGIATRVFKDGDIVEVDADNGVVKRCH